MQNGQVNNNKFIFHYTYDEKENRFKSINLIKKN